MVCPHRIWDFAKLVRHILCMQCIQFIWMSTFSTWLDYITQTVMKNKYFLKLSTLLGTVTFFGRSWTDLKFNVPTLGKHKMARLIRKNIIGENVSILNAVHMDAKRASSWWFSCKLHSEMSQAQPLFVKLIMIVNIFGKCRVLKFKWCMENSFHLLLWKKQNIFKSKNWELSWTEKFNVKPKHLGCI